MTAFPSIPDLKLPELPKLPALSLPSIAPLAPPAPVPLAGLPGTPERAAHVDSLVAANRAKTPPQAMGKRTNPRMTIEELNQQDPDELRDRFLNTRYDTRTPVQQVLDLIDLPRNVIANIAFHGAANDAAAKGDYAAFGLPKVTVSDALKNAGVTNRVALGLGGFLGDVVTDPLTYVGPAGWGAELGGVGLRSGGKALLKKATREAAVGGIEAVSDPLAKGVLRAAGVAEGPSAIQDVRKLVQGDASKSIAEKVFAPLGGETTSTGGVFAKYGQMGKHAENVAEHPNIDAVQNFIAQYGRGTGGGIKIGQGGSEIAHIPFTDKTLQVPGFTSQAARSLAALHLARDRELSNVFGATEKGNNAVGMVKPIIDQMRGEMMGAHDTSAAATILGADDAERVANTATFADSMTQKADQIAQIVRDSTPEKITGLNANGVAHLGELYREAESMRDLADGWRKASAATGPEAADAYGQVVDAAQRYRALIGGTLRTHIDPKTLAASEQIKNMLGTDDHTVGITALGSLKGALGNLFGHDSPVVNWVDNADRAVRNKFGIRSGEYPKRVADINYRANSGAIEQGGEVMGRFTTGIKGLMQQHGIPVSSYDDVAALSSIYAYQAAAQRLGVPLKDALFLKEVKNGKLVPGALMERMNALMKVMREKGAGREFHQGLKQIADQAAQELEAFGTKEQGAYQLNHMLSFYIPNVPKIETQLTLRGKKGSLAWESKAVSDHPVPRQAFQIQRSTNIYQFQDPKTGEWKQFRHLDIDRAKVGPDRMQIIERSNPKAANELKELQDTIAAYEALGDKAPPSRPSDFFSVNKAAAEGKLGALSIDPGKDFFEPSLPMWMGQRAASHERSMANAELASLMNHAGIMNSDQFLNIVGKVGESAKTIKLPGGTELHVRTVKSPFGGDIPIMYGNGESFRPLSRAMAGHADNPMISALWDAGKDMVLPEKLADLIEQKALAFKDENLAGLLSAMDKATGAFRSVTLLHPSWMIFDVIGNFANAASGDINLAHMLDELKQGINVKRAEMDPRRVADLVVKLPTGELRGQEALDYYKKVGALDRNFPANMGAALTTSGATGLPSQFNRVGLIPDLKTDHAYNLARNSGLLGKPGAAAASGMSLGWDRINRYVLSPWVRTNGFVNDAMRVAAHNALLRQGHDSAAATDKMRRALFDYSDLTHFERKYMRNIFPFWSWMRNNLPYQMSLLFQRPSYIAAAPKVQKALEEAIAGEQQVPMGLRPNWMRQSLATQIGSDPDSRMAYMLGNSLPQTELYNVIQGIMGAKGAQETLHYFGSALNPVVGAPLQLGAGQEYFSGRQIGSDIGQGDISTGEFLGNLVRPVAEVGRIADAARRSPVEAVGRAFIGGRLQGFSEQRVTSSRGRDLRDSAESVRRAITRAEAQGKSSVAQRARLLQIYGEATRLGLEQEVRVPRWAKNALPQMQEAAP